MTPKKWKVFRMWFTTTAALMLWALWLFGVFDHTTSGILIIVGVALAAIAIASYFYWKNLPDDI